MGSIWQETLNGFATFVKELQGKKDGIDYLFSLTTFDTQYDKPFVADPIDSVKVDALAAFPPRGSTALYDAIGETLQGKNGEPDNIDKFIGVIVTDGQENSSREWNKDRIQKLIEERLKQGNWSFAYLGTQPETWDESMGIGIARGGAAVYSGHQAQGTYALVATAVRSQSMGPSMGSRNFVTDNITKTQAKAVGMTIGASDDDADVVPGSQTAPTKGWPSQTPAPSPWPRPAPPWQVPAQPSPSLPSEKKGKDARWR